MAKFLIKFFIFILVPHQTNYHLSQQNPYLIGNFLLFIWLVYSILLQITNLYKFTNIIFIFPLDKGGWGIILHY